ncbi:MAG TPA: hypothetical protein VMF11_07980 [Candidatus Baltobacteraceae bacterium]|nr:hypothetical protein [Candidatus Baltobacteraceae bacterium]
MPGYDYTIQLTMDSDTVKGLKGAGFVLYGFKAVQGPQSGVPTVWFKDPNFSTTTTVQWSESYQAFVSNVDPIPGGQIVDSDVADIKLGQQAPINSAGTFDTVITGDAGQIEIYNGATRQYTTGIAQYQGGSYQNLCAFPTFGQMVTSIVPIARVFLMFATKAYATSTVVVQSSGPGFIIDLTASNNRQVSYVLNGGWSSNGQSWGTAVAANNPMNPFLILQLSQ